jgi:hypothetical protein
MEAIFLRNVLRLSTDDTALYPIKMQGVISCCLGRAVEHLGRAVIYDCGTVVEWRSAREN